MDSTRESSKEKSDDNPIGPHDFPFYSEKYNPKPNLHDSGTSNFIFNSHTSNNFWIVDSGASEHLSGNAFLFRNINSCDEISISLPNEMSQIVSSKGNVVISPIITLKDVYFAPSFNVNLLSINKLTTTDEFIIHFSKNHATIFDKVKMKDLGRAESRGSLYLLKHTQPRRNFFVGATT